MRLTALSLALLTVVSLPAGAQQRQSGDTFNWSGKIPSGRWIRVRNLNGRITVGQAPGDQVQVTATKHWRRGDPADVHFQVTKFGPNDESVLICALWFDNSTCDEDGYDAHGGGRHHNNDVNVEFHVLVPKGVKVGVWTVNGGAFVDGATDEVQAHTVNGDVEANSSGGPVSATTVNGSVRASMGKLDDKDLEFTTVNGGVTVELPADASADVELSTLNGSLHTDYELTVRGRMEPRHLSAHIGKPGGPRIRLRTVNGSIDLRQR
ncbi:MAG TPA: DUF4097 family beta strand repeat-containing protein [Gemmatimonadaceae bacterium]|nr:DUF4097 family beta strand repeat-containing protein [Gemmatimonadaceae bacterium]